MAYFTRGRTTPSRNLSALRQDCGVFCFVSVVKVNHTWQITHGARHATFEYGDIEAAQAWVKALHFMSKDFDRRLDCRIFREFQFREWQPSNFAGVSSLNPQSQFKATMETTVTDDEFAMIEQCCIEFSVFEILDPQGGLMAKAQIANYTTIYTSGPRLYLEITFNGEGFSA